MRRFAWLLVLGCTGGQTGEITEPTVCERVTDELTLEALAPEVREAFEDGAQSREMLLRWSDESTATLDLSFPQPPRTVERLGTDRCVPTWRAPIVIALRTDDGRLDAVLHGALLVREGAATTVLADATLASIHLPELDFGAGDAGSADADAGTHSDAGVDAVTDGVLRVSAEHDPPAWRGSLFLGFVDEEERVLATF